MATVPPCRAFRPIRRHGPAVAARSQGWAKPRTGLDSAMTRPRGMRSFHLTKRKPKWPRFGETQVPFPSCEVRENVRTGHFKGVGDHGRHAGARAVMPGHLPFQTTLACDRGDQLPAGVLMSSTAFQPPSDCFLKTV